MIPIPRGKTKILQRGSKTDRRTLPTVAQVYGCIQNRSLAHLLVHSSSFSPLLSRQRDGSLLHPYRQRQLPRRQHDALWPDDNLPARRLH